MLTSAECQAKADAKFAQAKREPRNRKRLLATAEGWVVVAGIMGRLEASAILPDDRQQE
jgi:hypothetical protein